MTALDQYQRLEAVALWRPSPDEQPLEVVVSFGHATLTLMDMNEAPRAHWSLAALEEVGSDAAGLVLSPDPDGMETLSLDDPQMIAAIRAVKDGTRGQDRSSSGSTRGALWTLLTVVAIALAGLFALREPMAELLVARIDDLTWERMAVALISEEMRAPQAAYCRPATAGALRTTRGHPLLVQMARRVSPEGVVIRPVLARFDGPPILPTPASLVLVNANGLPDATQPEEIAGLIALAAARHETGANRAEIASVLGLYGTLRLSFSGRIPAAERQAVRAALARAVVADDASDPELLRLLRAAALPSLPLSLILNDSGAPRSRIEGIQAGDSIGGEVYTPALDDADWLRLTAGCG